MQELHKQVARAHRRLLWQQFAAAFSWCLFATLLVAAIAIAVSKFVAVGIEPLVWLAAWMGGAFAAALLGAAAWTLWRRGSRLDAAIELDHRFGLKERVSSSLALDQTELESPAGQALLADALARVSR